MLHASYNVGKTENNISVDSGAANVSLPISLPSGVNGVQPKISISYNSQAGDGSVGLGFALTGLSEIHRCPRTKRHDNFRGKIDFNNTDRFCIDGKRLINVIGANGAGYTEYRLADEVTTKIISYGQQGNGPDYWEIWTKEGRIVEYGNTADSKIEALNSTTVKKWLVNQIADTSGNVIDYNYTEINGSESYINNIQYSGNIVVGTSHTIDVNFSYINRNTKINSYQELLEVNSKLLDTITVDVNGSEVVSYDLEYTQGEGDYKPLLNKVTECRLSDCNSPIDLNWDSEGYGIGNELNGLNTWIKGSTDYAPIDISRIKYGDFNGDGITDIYQVNGWGNTARDKIYLYNSDGQHYATRNGLNTWVNDSKTYGPIDISRLKFGDFNGDGITDIYQVNGWGNTARDKIYLYNSNGDHYATRNGLNTSINDGSASGPIDISRLKFGDFNGDGITDIYQVNGWGNSNQDKIFLYNSNGDHYATRNGLNSWIKNSTTYAPIDISRLKFGDFNGDGITDIYQVNGWGTTSQDKIYLYNSNGDHYATRNGLNTWVNDGSASAPIDISRLKFGDFNGDGITDIYQVNGWGNSNQDKIFLYNSNGDHYATRNGLNSWIKNSTTYAPIDISRLKFGDFNGDGITDIYQVNGWGNTSQDKIYFYNTNGDHYATRNGLNTSINDGSASGPIDISRITFSDFNGDGMLDIYQINGWNSSSLDKIFINKAFQPVLYSINDSFTNTTIEYEYATKTGFYIKTNNAASGYRDVRPPTRFVSKLNTSDGLGGYHSKTYTYSGLKIAIDGSESLGFETVSVKDNTLNQTVTTYYRQDYPYDGQVSRVVKSLGATTLSDLNNTFSVKNLYSGKVKVPYVSYNLLKEYDLDSSLLRTTTKVFLLDNWTNSTIDYTGVTGNQGQHSVINSNVYANTNSSVWHENFQLTSSAKTSNAPNGNSVKRSTSYSYSPEGLLETQIREPNLAEFRLVNSYDYDDFGNQVSVTTDGEGIEPRTSRSEYDETGRFKIASINAHGHVMSTEYDSLLGVPLTVTDANNLVQTNQYDALGRIVNTIAPTGTMVKIRRDWCNTNCIVDAITANDTEQEAIYTITTQFLGSDGITEYKPAIVKYFDSLQREIRVQTSDFSGQDIFSDINYNSLGQVSSTTSPYNYSTSNSPTINSYDSLGRLTNQISPDNGATSISYNGLTTTTTNSKYQTSSETKNVIGQVIKKVDAESNHLNIEYDAQGKVIKTTAPGGIVLQTSYDLLGRKISMDDPDMGHWEYTYDVLGQLISQKDAKNQITQMSYDKLGRMIQRVEHDGNYSQWDYYDNLLEGNPDYSMNGKLRYEISKVPTGGYSHLKFFGYDNYNRNINTGTLLFGPFEYFQVSKSYDQYGRVDKVTYPNSTGSAGRFSIKNHYQNGFLERVTSGDNSKTYWTVNARNVRGEPTNEVFGNNVQELSGFDNAGRRTTVDVSSGGSTYFRGDYAFDSIGNLVSCTTQHGVGSSVSVVETHGYDNLNRLTSVSSSSSSTPVSFSYDPLGNMVNKNGAAYEYNAGAHAVTKAGTKNYTYDANGNMLSGAGRVISWSPFNKPIQIANSNTQLNFKYAANRARYQQTILDKRSGQTEKITYIDKLFEKHVKPSVTEFRHYIPAGLETVAVYTVRDNNTEQTRYLHRDYLGSTVVVSDETGNSQANFSYDAFGKQKPVAGATSISYLSKEFNRAYTDHESLGDVGLIHMNGRVYDPELARFISADPFIQAPTNLQSYNRYSYVLNNPLGYTDPSGYFFSGVKKHLKRAVKGIKNAAVSIRKELKRFFVKYKWAREVGAAASAFFGGPKGLAVFSGYITDISGGSFSDTVSSMAMSFGISYLMSGWELSELTPYKQGVSPGKYLYNNVTLKMKRNIVSSYLRKNTNINADQLNIGLFALSFASHSNYESSQDSRILGSFDGFGVNQEGVGNGANLFIDGVDAVLAWQGYPTGNTFKIVNNTNPSVRRRAHSLSSLENNNLIAMGVLPPSQVTLDGLPFGTVGLADTVNIGTYDIVSHGVMPGINFLFNPSANQVPCGDTAGCHGRNDTYGWKY